MLTLYDGDMNSPINTKHGAGLNFEYASNTFDRRANTLSSSKYTSLNITTIISFTASSRNNNDSFLHSITPYTLTSLPRITPKYSTSRSIFILTSRFSLGG